MKREGGDSKKLCKVFGLKERGYDIGIIGAVLILSVIGILMVYSTSSVYAMKKFSDSTYFLKRQGLHFLVGVASMIVLMNADYRILKRFAKPAYVLGLFLLVAVLIPGIGREVGGGQRWMDIGFGAFQPSEFAKFFLVLYLAHSLSQKRDDMYSFAAGFAPHLLTAGLYIALILFEPDFGTALIVLVVLFSMLFIAQARIAHLGAFGIAALLLVILAVAAEGYRMERVISFLDPWQYRSDEGYQIIQSFAAFALGGWTGVGLGDSTQKLFYLPQSHTDFIFSIIGEELGFAGVISIISLFGFLITRCLRVALRAPDLFGCYLVFGLTILISLQAGINMAVALGLFPTKGLTLPFISYGGTSLVSSLGAIGVMISVSRSGVK